MKQMIIFCLFTALGLGVSFAEAENHPALRVEGQNIWDFGQVKAGKVVSHKFILKNSSPRTVKIKRADTSCGCTVSKISRMALEPFDESRIEVAFNSSGYQGKVEQKIFVRTDELDNPVVELIIRAEVVK
jgi:hypothetical protein